MSRPIGEQSNDFDGTLAPGNMQERSLIPSLGYEVPTFWNEVKDFAKRHNVDEISVYMMKLARLAAKQNKPLTKPSLVAMGAALTYFAGVTTWFERINSFGRKKGLDVEHYVVSSGNYEIIRGSSIWPHFKYVFASKYIYEEDGSLWPGAVINYTNKTQHLFRINKGIMNMWDNESVNRWSEPEDRPVPFSRMIFIGDGATDIPAMRMVRQLGGHSVAVYDPDPAGSGRMVEIVGRLIAEDRVSYVAPADYRVDSQLDVTIKGILGKIARAR